MRRPVLSARLFAPAPTSNVPPAILIGLVAFAYLEPDGFGIDRGCCSVGYRLRRDPGFVEHHRLDRKCQGYIFPDIDQY